MVRKYLIYGLSLPFLCLAILWMTFIAPIVLCFIAPIFTLLWIIDRLKGDTISLKEMLVDTLTFPFQMWKEMIEDA